MSARIFLLWPLLLVSFANSWAANTNDSQRITSTRLSPSVPIGGPAIVTWSIVPDGTTLPNFSAATSNPPSNLIERFDILYGVPVPSRDPDNLTGRPWFVAFENSFHNYERKSGLSYQYLHDSDDSSPFTSGPLAGQRGDVRIGGTALINNLGYNNPPNGSDMVLSTSGSTFGSLSSLQLVFTHEHAHGLGFGHVLVEGNAARSVVSGSGGNANGPQFDDLLQIHRKYGDKFEKAPGNDIRTNAINLGTLVESVEVIVGDDADDLIIQAGQEDFVSIDDDSDKDFYAFSLPMAGSVTIEVEPRGPTYSYQPEGEASVTLNAASESDLLFRLRNSAGTTLFTQDTTAAGVLEIRLDESLNAGDYTIEVAGKDNLAQMYALTVLWGELDDDGDGLPNSAEVAGDADGDGIDNLQDPDADGDGTKDGAEVAVGRLPYDVRDLAFEFENDGDPESWSGSNLVNPLLIAAGAASGQALTGDPQVERSDLFVDGNLVTGLFVRLSSSSGTSPQFFWSHDGVGGAGFSASRQVTTTYVGAGAFETIYFELASDPEWTGKKITAFRFDPPGGTNSTFEIDWIRAASPNSDRDGDGKSDLAEFNEGRDPFDLKDLAFEFNTDDDFEGWDGTSNITNPIVAGGFLSGTATNGDPFRTHVNFNFPGENLPVLLVNLKASQTGTTQLFWGIDEANNFAAGRRIDLPYSGAPNSLQILVFDFSNNPDWLGQQIRRLRIDPISKANATFDIDWVRGSDGDYDNDGLPDLFESANNLDLLDSSDALLDNDNDGQNNLQEFIAGTGLDNPQDQLVIETCSWENGQFEGTLAGKSGRVYQLLRWTGIEGEAWLEVPESLAGPLSSDASLTLSDPNAGSEKFFYRAEVTLP